MIDRLSFSLKERGANREPCPFFLSASQTSCRKEYHLFWPRARFGSSGNPLTSLPLSARWKSLSFSFLLSPPKNPPKRARSRSSYFPVPPPLPLFATPSDNAPPFHRHWTAYFSRETISSSVAEGINLTFLWRGRREKTFSLLVSPYRHAPPIRTPLDPITPPSPILLMSFSPLLPLLSDVLPSPFRASSPMPFLPPLPPAPVSLHNCPLLHNEEADEDSPSQTPLFPFMPAK